MISSTFERALPNDAVASAIMLYQQARRLAAGAWPMALRALQHAHCRRWRLPHAAHQAWGSAPQQAIGSADTMHPVGGSARGHCAGCTPAAGPALGRRWPSHAPLGLSTAC
jgi:type II secretory pathway pseudopilin PulG